MATKEEKTLRKVAQTITILSFVILVIIAATTYTIKAEQESVAQSWIIKAAAQNNPELCSEVELLKEQAQCFTIFINKEAFQCEDSEGAATAPGCLLAHAVHMQDVLLCDAYFPPEQLPYNLECRVSVFIERYTDEGLSDCCHI